MAVNESAGDACPRDRDLRFFWLSALARRPQLGCGATSTQWATTRRTPSYSSRSREPGLRLARASTRPGPSTATRSRRPSPAWTTHAKGKSIRRPNPPPSTWSIDDGPEEAKGKTSKGIYKLDGEKLTICVSVPGKDRPKDFAQVDDEAYLFELKKEKKKD